MQEKYSIHILAAFCLTLFKRIVVVVYPTPSEGWGQGGRPWIPRSRETPQVWTRGRTETESRQRVRGAKNP